MRNMGTPDLPSEGQIYDIQDQSTTNIDIPKEQILK
jgi:hypothetical protein